MLVERDELPQGSGIELLGKNQRAWPISIKVAMRLLVGCPPKSESLGLGNQIRKQRIMLSDQVVSRSSDTDEINRNDIGALMKKLEEGVLAVCSWLTPNHWPGGAGDRHAGRRHRLAI